MASNKFVAKALRPNAIFPKRATRGSAGYDLFLPNACVITKGVNRLELGMSLRPPIGFFARMIERSSAATIGLQIGGGIIDDDFDINTEIILIVYNHLDFEIKAERGKSIAQLIFYKKYSFETLEIGYKETEHALERSEHTGVGSTGNAITVPELESIPYTQPKQQENKKVRKAKKRSYAGTPEKSGKKPRRAKMAKFANK